MFTRKRLPPMGLSGDWAKDGPQLVKWISNYLGELEAKNALTISQAQIYADQGLQFPATQVASADANNLDDYRERTDFTPTLTFATPGNLSVTYSIRMGDEWKVGDRVFLTFEIVTSAYTFTTASGAMSVTGSHYTATADGNYRVVGGLEFSGITKVGYTQFVPYIVAGTNTITFSASGTGSSLADVVAADTTSGGAVTLRGWLMFRTTS